MKQWRFEVFNRSSVSDVHGNGVLDDIRELGITTIEAVQSAKVFLRSSQPMAILTSVATISTNASKTGWLPSLRRNQE